jgi:hypothetical protein
LAIEVDLSMVGVVVLVVEANIRVQDHLEKKEVVFLDLYCCSTHY